VKFDAVLKLAADQAGETADLPDTGDLEADLKLVFRATLEGLTDPRYDAAMRALATEIPHDPALAADYVERLDGPLIPAFTDAVVETALNGLRPR
jgi:Tetracyclin repressor-like, C-terminal domain